MANFNRIILAGNLTRDPELSQTTASVPVCKFGLAVNRNWTDKETNAKREETMFVDCTAWARRAEVINQYFQKGKPILIEGRLAFDTWTTPEGQKRSKHSVVVDSFEFLGGPASDGERSQAAGPPAAEQNAPPPREEAPF